MGAGSGALALGTGRRGVAEARASAGVGQPGIPPVRLHSAALREDWAAFRRLYVTPEGRVVDTGNGNVSHSEGQGWGLMAAQAADDPQSFERLLDWTTRHLQIRDQDALHAWRYKPRDAYPVTDLNNATDGDLFIAAALARAAARWDRPDYAARAARIARDILRLVRTAGPRTVLLPGAAGFEKPDSYVINPSYYGFALFQDLAALAPSPHWQALRQDGAAMLQQACFGRWQLPPDWLRVDRRDGALAVAPGWPPRFSYDAIRVPLHVAWGGMPALPVLEAFRRYWVAPRTAPPAWTDLRTGEEAAYGAPAGIRAVAVLATHAPGPEQLHALPSVMAATDYYGSGLILLSRIAAEERAGHQPG